MEGTTSFSAGTKTGRSRFSSPSMYHPAQFRVEINKAGLKTRLKAEGDGEDKNSIIFVNFDSRFGQAGSLDTDVAIGFADGIATSNRACLES